MKAEVKCTYIPSTYRGNKHKNFIFSLAVWKLTAGSYRDPQSSGTDPGADPDPYQNVTDPDTGLEVRYNFKKIWESSLGRYVFGSEISYNKAPPRLPGLGC